jgi:hypothetical protein
LGLNRTSGQLIIARASRAHPYQIRLLEKQVTMHVIVANEPGIYREVIAAALQMLRPELIFTAVEPASLDEAVGRLSPRLVLCSVITEVVEARVADWIVLYSDGPARVVISLAGQRTSLADIELEGLLSIVDRTGIPA